MQFRTLQYSVPGAGDSTKQAELIVSVFVDGDGGPLDANMHQYTYMHALYHMVWDLWAVQ